MKKRSRSSENYKALEGSKKERKKTLSRTMPVQESNATRDWNPFWQERKEGQWER